MLVVYYVHINILLHIKNYEFAKNKIKENTKVDILNLNVFYKNK